MCVCVWENIYCERGWTTYNYGKQIRVCSRVSYICLGVMTHETFQIPGDMENIMDSFPTADGVGKSCQPRWCVHTLGWTRSSSALESFSHLQSFQLLKLRPSRKKKKASPPPPPKSPRRSRNPCFCFSSLWGFQGSSRGDPPHLPPLKHKTNQT